MQYIAIDSSRNENYILTYNDFIVRLDFKLLYRAHSSKFSKRRLSQRDTNKEVENENAKETDHMAYNLM